MNKLLLIGAEDISGVCHGLLPIIRVIRKGVFPIIQVGIPIVLIVLGTIDLGKAVISSDDKEVKAAQGRLIKRILYAAIIFFMTTIVTLVFNIIGTANDNDVTEGSASWADCWREAGQ